MMRLLTRLLINASSLILMTRFIPGLYLSSFSTAIWAAIVWGLINALVRPIFSFFTFPL